MSSKPPSLDPPPKEHIIAAELTLMEGQWQLKDSIKEGLGSLIAEVDSHVGWSGGPSTENIGLDVKWCIWRYTIKS